MKRVALIISMVTAVFAGCTESRDSDPVSAVAVAHAGESVSTDQADYALNAPVVVSWAGLPGNQTDWVTVVTAGSPPNSGFVNNQYKYTNGAASGSTTFTGFPAGTYEARAYENDTYTILATSTFTVQGGVVTAVVSTDHTTYAPNQTIVVNWSGFPGNQLDWVAITTAGSPPDSGFKSYAYVNGATSGSQTFAGLPAGSYEARGYKNDTYTVIASSTFSVSSGATTITTDRSSYTVNQSITVTWSGLPGASTDYVSINTGGSAANDGFLQTFQTGGATNGSHTFSGVAAGSYDARAYAGATYDILAQTSFQVSSASISTDHTTYSPGQSITINWAGFPGNQMDFVAISTAGSPPDSGFQTFQFVNGQTSGSVTFAGLVAGSYEARGYVNGTYSIIASSNFTVGAAATTITTDMSTYMVNQAITVTWAGMPGTMTDYVTLNTAGDAANASPLQQFSTGGATSGSHTFTGLTGGNYEARAYTGTAFEVLATASFVVSSATVTTDASTYTVGSAITVTYHGLPGNPQDWISIAPVGSSATTSVAYQFTGGATDGTVTFSGLGAGTYEARAYVNNTYTIIATSPSFTITVNNACTTGGARPTFSGVQSGDLVMDSASTEVTAALTVPLDSSILFFSIGEREPSPYYGGVNCSLHAVDDTLGLPAGITCDRNNFGTDSGSGSISIHWSVATFSSGVAVQRGAVNTGTSTPATITLATAAPLANSFVLLGGTLNNGSGWGNNEFVKATLTNPTTLDVRTTIAGTQTFYQVVTMTGATVQRGSVSLATADTQAQVAITATPSGTFPMISYNTDNSNGVNASQLMVQSNLIDPSTLLIKRGAGGTNIDVSWEVVSLPFATHSDVSLFSAGQSSISESVPGASATTCVAVTGSQAILGQSGGSTDYAGADIDLVGEGAASLSVGSSALVLSRPASTSSAEIPWTVIDFSHNCDGT